MSESNEISRVQAVYKARDIAGKRRLYKWNSPISQYQRAVQSRIFASALRNSLGDDVSQIRVLDVGCGTGGFLRTFVEWGAAPRNLMGTEFLKDRLQRATESSVSGISWKHGGLDFGADDGFDLVSAHTVFSSILDDQERVKLANQMWHKVCRGGVDYDF